jgi:hypothetical protein
MAELMVLMTAECWAGNLDVSMAVAWGDLTAVRKVLMRADWTAACLVDSMVGNWVCLKAEWTDVTRAVSKV